MATRFYFAWFYCFIKHSSHCALISV